MPRKPRSRQVPEVKLVQLSQVVSTARTVRYRFTCPLCGMMPEVERLESSPYDPQWVRQEFGGRTGELTPEGKPQGYMSYDRQALPDWMTPIMRVALSEAARKVQGLEGKEGEIVLPPMPPTEPPERPPKPKRQTREERLATAIEKIHAGLADVETLGEEAGSWADGMEGTNLEATQRYQDLRELVDSLEAIRGDMETQISELDAIEFP